jgi:hypothetical protein
MAIRQIFPAVALLCCSLFFQLMSAAAGEPPQYCLWYEPDLVVAVDSPELLEQASGWPFSTLAVTAAWDKLPLLSAFDRTRLLTALKKHGLADLRYFVVPDLDRMLNLEALAYARTKSDAATFLASAGIAATASDDSRFSLPDGSELFGKTSDGFVFFSTDRKLLENFSKPGKATAESWPAALNEFLARRHDRLDLWLPTKRLFGYAGLKTGFPLTQRFLETGLSQPRYATLSLQPLPGATRLSCFLPWEHDAPPSPAPTSHPALRELCLRRNGSCFSVNRDVLASLPGGDKTAWNLILSCVDFFAPGAKEEYNLTFDALRMLTGLHPGAHLLSSLRGEITLALLPEKKKFSWTAVGLYRDGRKLSHDLALSLAWAQFISGKKKHPLRVTKISPAKTESCWQVASADEKTICMIGLTADKIIAASDSETFSETLAVLGKPTETPHRLLAWSLSLPQEIMSKNLSHFFDGETPGLLQFLLLNAARDRCRGELRCEDGGFTLETEGMTTPLPEMCGALFLGKQLTPAEDNSRVETAAANLRLFLDAQQVYRHLNLGLLNGGGKGYAPGLGALVRGKGEKDSNLSDYFSALYPLPRADYTFAELVEYLASGEKSVGGYSYRQPLGRDGAELDYSRHLALIAWPDEPDRYPALLIDEKGAIYRRAASGEIQPLPATLPGGGWTPLE